MAQGTQFEIEHEDSKVDENATTLNGIEVHHVDSHEPETKPEELLVKWQTAMKKAYEAQVMLQEVIDTLACSVLQDEGEKKINHHGNHHHRNHHHHHCHSQHDRNHEEQNNCNITTTSSSGSSSGSGCGGDSHCNRRSSRIKYQHKHHLLSPENDRQYSSCVSHCGSGVHTPHSFSRSHSRGHSVTRCANIGNCHHCHQVRSKHRICDEYC